MEQRRVVRGALRTETAPPMTEVAIAEDFFTGVAIGLAKIAARFASELLLLASSGAAWVAIASLSSTLATVSVVATWLALLVSPRSRRLLLRHLRHARLRRRFADAARLAGIATVNDHVPVPRRIIDTPAGEQIIVRIPSGSAFSLVEAASERLATGLDAREVRVDADRTSARYARITVIRRDPFDRDARLVWPHFEATTLSAWDPIPVGVDELGATVYVNLPERNLLLGGEPGAGKSVALLQLVAAAALDPTCQLTLLDGKRVELACWAGSATHAVGPSLDDANEVLRSLRVEMDARYSQLLKRGARKVDSSMGIPLHVVVCDELAFYLTMGERKQNQEFATLMRDLVARGRAAGVIVVAATQKPSHDIIPTSLRDLFAFRWALRCTTPQASDTILGQGWASEGFSAKDIDGAQRGVGYLLHEGGEPVRLKSFYLSDTDIDRLAAVAEERRAATALTDTVNPLPLTQLREQSKRVA